MLTGASIPPRILAQLPPNFDPTFPSEMRGRGCHPRKMFEYIVIFNFVHSGAFWSNLLIDYTCEFCCNSFTVCNSLKAKGLAEFS